MEQTRAEDRTRVPRATDRARVPGQAGPPDAARAPLPGEPRFPERHSVRAQVLDALGEALLAGELAPGEVYSAPALAERFGVSATPVREAMQLLAGDGAVETVPNRGFRVVEHTRRDAAELAEVRALLEVPAVLGAAARLAPGRWEELRPFAEDTLAAAACGDRCAYAAADRAFHTALLRTAGNAHLAVVAAGVHRRAQRRPSRNGTPGAAQLLGEASEHVVLLDALEAGDAAQAERVLRDHLAV